MPALPDWILDLRQHISLRSLGALALVIVGGILFFRALGNIIQLILSLALIGGGVYLFMHFIKQ